MMTKSQSYASVKGTFCFIEAVARDMLFVRRRVKIFLLT